MAARMELVTSFNAERQHVQLVMEEAGTPLAHMTIELPELIDLIARLGQYRAEFSEQVPPRLDPGMRLMALADPIYRVAQNPSLGPGEVALQIRHPHYGWLSFALPGHEARHMADLLMRLAGPAG